MERYSSSSNRLYSGPLSASGQKILAALRAQSHNHYSDTVRAQSYRQHERYDSRPRGYQSEASWSRGTQEERRGREADRPWSRPQSYSQSSSSWDAASQRDYSQTPALSQDSASSSTHRMRYPLALHTPSNEPHWRDAPEETEPTFSLHFALEDQGPSRPPLPRVEYQREKPTGACGPPFSRANVSVAPKNHVISLETQSEGWDLGSGDGEWQCPERSQEETSIAPEDQRERLAKAKPIEVALAGRGDADRRAPVPVTKWQFGSIVLPPPQRAYKAEEKADCDKKRPARGLLLPAPESEDFTMKDMDSGPSFKLRMEDDIGESCALEKDSFGASHTVERDGFGASHTVERDGFGASQGLERGGFGASHIVERDGFGASQGLERDGFGASHTVERDGFGASQGLERDGFGASHTVERDGFGASQGLERGGFGASHIVERDGFGASQGLERDGFGASHTVERDGFGASHTVERDGFGASHTVERDSFGASQGLERDGFGASHTVERDGFGASHALERDGFGASQGLETDFGASHTVERDGFGASHSMERDGFGASHSLKRDGFGASHALQRDGIGEKLLFNEGDVTGGHRDSTESPCVVGLADQQGTLHGDTAQSEEEIVTGGGPRENLSERDPFKRKRLFGDMTTDNQRGMGGGEMGGRVERERKDDINKGGLKKKMERKNSRSSTKPHQQRKVSPSLGQMRDGEGQGVTETDSHPEERRNMDGPLVTAAQRNSGGNTEPLAAGHFIPKPSQEGGRVFRAPTLRGTCLGQTPLATNHHNDTQAGDGGSRERGLSIDPALNNPSLAGHGRAAGLGSGLTSIRTSGEEESSGHHRLLSAQQPPLTPTFSLKSEHGTPLPKIALFRRPVKWEPPQSCQEKARTLQRGQEWCKTQTPKHPDLTPAFSLDPRAKTKTLHKTEGTKSVALIPNPPHRPPANPVRPRQGVPMGERGLESTRDHSSSDTPQHRSSKTPKPPKPKRAKPGPNQCQLTPETEPEGGSGAGDPRAQSNQSKTCLTTAMISDPRVRDAGKLSPEERGRVLEEAGQASALVLTMVYQDGTTQMDPEQKLSPSVCGVLVMLKRDLDQTGPVPGPEEGVAQRDSLVYLRLEQKPAWAQSHQDHNLDLFNREMLLQVVSGSQLVVCYKAKDLLRTALQHYRPDLHWKQFSSCRVQDPQVAAWLLDPADPSSCFTNLLTKHCRTPLRTPTPALGARKVYQVISSLSLLYQLNMELRSKLQSQGLWELYSNMELTMIPVLAAMESHRIHVDTESLKTTSEMLGTKMKQLEHEAHQAAGQMFLVSSSTQLRTVLFEKLRLQERCENKKLPKTLNKQQQSTSEAVLLQLQDLHPLPKIILEYRQVHKIKSTFVDGVLSCMMSKNFISSTWYQTSAVTGRISAKHPNFQALPRQPVQITKKQYVQGKEAEVVTVHPRAMFIPQDGYTFLAADFCQVELRLLAHLSSDPELQRIFNNPQADVFTMLASQWKGVSEGEVSSEDREHAKRIVYSVVYGAGRERLSGILGVSAEQASHFQDSFLHTYREVQTFIHTTIQQCHKRGYVVSIMGRRRTLPHIHSTDWGVRMQAERQAVNFVVQGSAADLCKMAMIRIFSQVSSSSSLSARLIAQLHDELLYEVEDSQVGEFAVLVKNTMESLQHIDCLGVHLKVPLKVAVSSGKSWGSMSELHLPQTSLPPSS